MLDHGRMKEVRCVDCDVVEDEAEVERQRRIHVLDDELKEAGVRGRHRDESW